MSTCLFIQTLKIFDQKYNAIIMVVRVDMVAKVDQAEEVEDPLKVKLPALTEQMVRPVNAVTTARQVTCFLF